MKQNYTLTNKKKQGNKSKSQTNKNDNKNKHDQTKKRKKTPYKHAFKTDPPLRAIHSFAEISIKKKES